MRFIRLYLKTYSGLSTPAWMLALVLLINRSGSMVIPFLSIYLKNELQFGLKEVGIILSMFGLGSLFGSFIGGWLSDRVGTFWVQFLALMGGGVGFIYMERVQTFEGLAIGFMLVTTVTDALRPANAAAVSQHAKKENLTRAYSLNRMAVNLGYSIGPVAGGLLAAINYSWIFYVDGITCMAAGVMFFIYFFRKKPRNPRPVEGEAKKEYKALRRKHSPYRDPSYLGFIMLTAGFGVIFFQIFNTLPLYYREYYHLSEGTIGLLLGLNGFIVFLVEMPLVYAMGSRYSLRSIVVVGVLLTGASYLFLNIAMGIWILVISMAILSVAEILVMPYLTTYTARKAHESVRGRYMGLYTMAYSLAFIIAPALGTYLLGNFGYSWLWFAMGGLGILVGAGFLKNMRDVHAEPEASAILSQTEQKHPEL